MNARRWLETAALLCVTACNNAPASTDSSAASTAAARSGATPTAAAAEALESCDDTTATDHHGHDHAKRPKTAPSPMASGNHYGNAFALGKSEALSKVLPRLGDDKAEKVQVSGVVDKVCQAKGCWMVLKDGDVHARIFTKGHNFYLPTDVAGAKATAEGTIKTRSLSEKFAKHLAEDSGGDPGAIKGAQREYVMYASGIKLVPSS